jgi:hypothetical protein
MIEELKRCRLVAALKTRQFMKASKTLRIHSGGLLGY